jgi:archaellum component FlaC
MSSEHKAVILMDFLKFAESSKSFGESIMTLNTPDKDLDDLLEMNKIANQFTKVTDGVEEISKILLPLIDRLP